MVRWTCVINEYYVSIDDNKTNLGVTAGLKADAHKFRICKYLTTDSDGQSYSPESSFFSSRLNRALNSTHRPHTNGIFTQFWV